MITTRKDIRDRLATELTTAYGANVFAVFPYMATKFEGKSPVVRVVNAGSLRPRVAGVRPAADTAIRYVVQHFVRFDEADTNDEQEDSEDDLDALELILSQFMSDNDQIPGVWKSIQTIDYSEPALVKISAFQYLLEAFLVEIKIDA